MNKWLSAQRVRILVPLIGAVTFGAALLGAVIYHLAFAGATHHYYWRPLLFGSALVTLAAVTGIKYRHQEPETLGESAGA